MEYQDNLETKSFLQSAQNQAEVALKISQFENEGNKNLQISSERSRIVRIFMLKYKCIFNLTLILICVLQFVYIAFKEFMMNTELREALFKLIDKVKYNNDSDSDNILNINATNKHIMQ